MGLDLIRLTGTPDLRAIPALHARIVGAFRYTHIARRIGRYSEGYLVEYLGSEAAVVPFHAFADAIGSAWPDPVFLNAPCQMRLSFDEILILDLGAAAAKSDRRAFDALLEEMLSARARDGLWRASRRLMALLQGGGPAG